MTVSVTEPELALAPYDWDEQSAVAPLPVLSSPVDGVRPVTDPSGPDLAAQELLPYRDERQWVTRAMQQIRSMAHEPTPCAK